MLRNHSRLPCGCPLSISYLYVENRWKFQHGNNPEHVLLLTEEEWSWGNTKDYCKCESVPIALTICNWFKAVSERCLAA